MPASLSEDYELSTSMVRITFELGSIPAHVLLYVLAERATDV